MKMNLHTHTWRCGHALKWEEDYVKTAIEEGFDILGFADHTPQFFPGDYYSNFRMRPELLPGYCKTVRNLAQQYASQIQIPLGLEVEFYPSLLPQLLPVIRDQGVEYMLLGQHFVGDEIGEHYCGYETADLDILKRYVRQTAEGMQTGMFTYLAHPDLIFFTGSDRDYRQQMRILVQEAKGCDMPLEVNLMGKWCGRNYPDRRFWELVAEEGCRVVIGWDAHAAKHLAMHEQEAFGRALVQELGLNLVDTVPLQKF